MQILARISGIRVAQLAVHLVPIISRELKKLLFPKLRFAVSVEDQRHMFPSMAANPFFCE